MAWLYADYVVESVAATKLSKLRLHVVEVSQALAAPTSQTIDGMSYSKPVLENYLATLKLELKSVERLAGANTGVMFVRGRLHDQ